MPVALACALAVAGCGREAERQHATPEQARAACEAFRAPVTRDQDDILERHAKALLHSQYDDLGAELTRYVALDRILVGGAAHGAVRAEDIEKSAESARRIGQLCIPHGVTPPPDE